MLHLPPPSRAQLCSLLCINIVTQHKLYFNTRNFQDAVQELKLWVLCFPTLRAEIDVQIYCNKSLRRKSYLVLGSVIGDQYEIILTILQHSQAKEREANCVLQGSLQKMPHLKTLQQESFPWNFEIEFCCCCS